MLTVAAARDDFETEKLLRFSTGIKVRLIPVAAGPLQEAIFAAYNGDAETLERSAEELRSISSPGKEEGAYPEFRGAAGSVSKFLETLIDYAISHRASDLHIIPGWNGTKLRLRINGELLSRSDVVCGLSVHQQLVARLKVLALLDISQRNIPQDGAFNVPLSGRRPARVRLSILPTIHGEKAVLRFQTGQEVIALQDLGFAEPIQSWLLDSLNRGEGMLLFCGPTGSGKSTSMYSCLKHLSARNVSIATIEDPVEIELPDASQTSINDQVGLTFERCLRSIVRQDPDVILLGEIRDRESAKTAFESALTGHLVLSTVHARGINEIFMRLCQLGVPNDLQASALLMCVTQRLIPALCRNCKVFDLEATNEWDFEIHKPVGCHDCDYSGYAGRVLTAEAVLFDERVRAWAADPRRSAQGLDAAFSSDNFSPMGASVVSHLRACTISAADAK